MGTTSKLFLRYPAAGAANNVPADIQNLADDVDSRLAGQGTYAARPGGTLRDGARYYCTDLGVELRAYGNAWIMLSPRTTYGLRTDRPAVGTVVAGSEYYATDTGVKYISDGSAWRRDHDPVGVIKVFPLEAAPAGHVLANGQQLSTSNAIYADLYALYGSTFGTGTGTFKVPDLRNRWAYFNRAMGGVDRGEFSAAAAGYGDSTGYVAGSGGVNLAVFRMAGYIRI